MNFSPEYMTGMSKKAMSLSAINEAIKEGSIIESLVTSCDDDLTLTLDIGKDIVGKITFDNIEYKYDNTEVKAIAAMSKVGKHVKFVPTAIEYIDGKHIVTCSRKLAQSICYKEFISKLVPGDVIDARIIRVENYGVFCDIGCGIVALLPTNLISVTHIINPRELLADTTTLKVVVKHIQEDGKIQLSHRELLGTWEQEASKLKVGSTVCGAVLSVEDYGIFIRLSQNLSGLASPTGDVNVKTGDVVSVHINSIAENTLKIKLNIVNKIDNCSEMLKFNYYITEGHIDKWLYSPNGKKIIESNFEGLKNE